MDSNIVSRALEFCKSKGIRPADFERTCGLANGMLKKLSDRTRHQTYIRISNAFPDLNIEWLKTGEGEMIAVSVTRKDTDDISNTQEFGHPVRMPYELLRQVRMFTVTPTATFTEMSSCFNDEVSTIGIVPEAGEYLDKSYAVFEIRGVSMEPTVRDHAKILCKELPESRWHDAEGVVVISYKDRVVLKRILRNSFYIDNTILLGSDNPDKKYASTETVQWSDIHAIFKAKRILSQDIL